MKHDKVQDLLPEHILGTLGPWGRLRVGLHLRRCALCQAEAREDAEALALLSRTVDQLDPPPGLVQRVLARVKTSPGARSGPFTPPGVPTTSPLFGTMLKTALALAAVLLLVVAGTAAWGVYLQNRLGDLEARGRELRQDVQEQRRLVYQSVNPEVKGIPLGGAAGDGQARGVFVAQPEEDWGTLVTAGLKPLPAGTTYQVWFVAPDGRLWSFGFLHVDETGWGQVDIRTVIPVKVFRAIWISVEPVGGSDFPRGETVLGGEIE